MAYSEITTRRKGSKWRHKQRERLFLRQQGKCYWCGIKLTLFPCRVKRRNRQMTIDHLIAVCLGGGNEETNLVGLCLHCNMKRAVWQARSRGRFSILEQVELHTWRKI